MGTTIHDIKTPSIRAGLAQIAERVSWLETNYRLAVTGRDEARNALDAARNALDAARERISDLEDIELELRGKIEEYKDALVMARTELARQGVSW